MLHRYVTETMHKKTPSKENRNEFSYVIACSIGSTIGILHKWARENFQVPAEVIADILTQTFMSGMLPLIL